MSQPVTKSPPRSPQKEARTGLPEVPKDHKVKFDEDKIALHQKESQERKTALRYQEGEKPLSQGEDQKEKLSRKQRRLAFLKQRRPKGKGKGASQKEKGDRTSSPPPQSPERRVELR